MSVSPVRRQSARLLALVLLGLIFGGELLVVRFSVWLATGK
jgi:hypothetical protein